MDINGPVQSLPLIGPKQANLLQKLEINTIFGLLNHFPSYYKDSSTIVTLSELDHNIKKTVIVEIVEIKNIRLRNGKFIQKGIVKDATGACPVTWFHQPYITKTLKPGIEVMLSAKLNPKSSKPEIISPEYEIIKEQNIHMGKIVPVYPLTTGLSVKWLRNRFAYLVNQDDLLNKIPNDLPKEIEAEKELLNPKQAYKYIHFPSDINEIINARKRLAFSELLGIYIKLKKEQLKRLKGTPPAVRYSKANLIKEIQSLPFILTDSQDKALEEIGGDFNSHVPMYRLLQGDVGSGKTIVALLSALSVINSGYQVVIMVPTSVLAKQHFETASKLFKGIKTKLLISTTKNEKETEESYDLIIATHAIFYHKDKYIKNLGLVIIDEQHRFGVAQQKDLLDFPHNKCTPHVLHMTATPIPRSIALTLFGDINVSIIEKPEGRKIPQTKIVPNSKREDSYSWIESQIKSGGQIFWICPLIEENTENPNSLTNVNDLYKSLQITFPKLKIGLLHGKIKDEQKQKILKDFRDNEIQILVSTTVVEVGIDIPNANIIIIENADRYGLAQLHQLRGRVGRNNQESWCLLYTNLEDNPTVINRLRFFSSESEGIKIAEFDLKTRGPGEVYGTIQAGIPKLKIANFGNSAFLKEVHEVANKILNF